MKQWIDIARGAPQGHSILGLGTLDNRRLHPQSEMPLRFSFDPRGSTLFVSRSDGILRKWMFDYGNQATNWYSKRNGFATFGHSSTYVVSSDP